MTYFNSNSSKVGIISLLIIGFVQLSIYGNLYYLGDLRDSIIIFFGNYFLLFISYIIAIYILNKCKSKEYQSWILLAIIFFFSISFRFLMVISETYLSTDIFRYMWDGMLSGNWTDPYKYVPSSLELDNFKGVEYYEIYDHKDEFTIYPPFAQIFFFVSHLLFGNSQLGMKSFLSIFDILNGSLIFLLIKSQKNELFRAFKGTLIYLWNPLVIIEFSNSGHLDVLAIFLILLSLYFLTRSLIIGSLVSLVASVFTKWIPLLFVPFYIKFLMNKEKFHLIKTAFPAIIFSLAIILPFYLSSGLNFLRGMTNFIQNWRFESTLSRFIMFIFPFEGLDGLNSAKVMSYAIFIISLIVVLNFVKLLKILNLVDSLIVIIALFYLITPSIFPWYAIWLLALSCIRGTDFITLSSISLSGIAVLNYLQEFSKLNQFQFWAAYTIWFIPIIAILIFYLHRSKIVRKVRSNRILRLDFG